MSAVCAAFLVVAGAWILGDALRPITTAASLVVQPLSVGTASPLTELADVETPLSDRREVDVSPAVQAPEFSRNEVDESRLPRTGTLVVRCVDAESGEAILAPRVRAVSAARFAEESAEDGSEDRVLRLTPGEYALHVGSAGYEPTELGPVRVTSGETTLPERVRLVPGAGRIAGRAQGALVDDLVVELQGDGRRRCGASCAEACARCGWDRDRSRRPIGAAGEFEFERLASGVYLVRIVDERGDEAATPARVRLGVDETLRIDVRIARARTVVVALDDVDGSPLDRVWSERLARPVPDRVALSTMSVLKWSARVLDGEFLVAEGEFSPPDPTGTALRMGRGMSTYCPTGRSWIRDDRARLTDDTLSPPVLIPELEVTYADVHVGVDGLVRCEAVPARAKSLALGCETFQATVPLHDATNAVRRARLLREPKSGEPALTFLAFEHAYYN